MAQYVLNHGGLKLGDKYLWPGSAAEPQLVELSEAEAAKLNGPEELWGRKGACLVPVAKHKAELAANAAASEARAKVLNEAAKAAPKAEAKPDAKGGAK